MPTIQWDQPGERVYQGGVDRGVLYLPDGGAVPWNGLVSVNEKVVGNERTAVYYDGTKYADAYAVGDFAATLRAYTYPDEFLDLEGVVEVDNGLFLANQDPKRFGLSYRTRVGDDEAGPTAGYRIHVLYNLTAVPTQKSYQTIMTNDITSFEWDLTAVPGEVEGYRATAHLIFDTRSMSPLLVQDIENTLYGDGVTQPTLPPISNLVSFIANWVIIRITENIDGSWTAEGPDDLITMLDATTFQIIQIPGEYLDADTYMISDKTN
jgi:hypothetical protein